MLLSLLPFLRFWYFYCSFVRSFVPKQQKTLIFFSDFASSWRRNDDETTMTTTINLPTTHSFLLLCSVSILIFVFTLYVMVSVKSKKMCVPCCARVFFFFFAFLAFSCYYFLLSNSILKYPFFFWLLSWNWK